ncbi:MAG: DUF393 domain-containing protein [Planctomycetes bacterium]|nr:DUF393 domain-containing protein [Planctomycetota bacterium]
MSPTTSDFPAGSLEPAACSVTAPATDRPESPLILFDGVCGLCNHWIDFVLARDRQQQFRFSPLQGETARRYLGPETPETLKSVVLLDETGTYRKSDAVCRMLIRLGGVWSLAGWMLRCIPAVLRNWGYDLVAARRYRWFGEKSTCRMPTASERARFLP